MGIRQAFLAVGATAVLSGCMSEGTSSDTRQVTESTLLPGEEGCQRLRDLLVDLSLSSQPSTEMSAEAADAMIMRLAVIAYLFDNSTERLKTAAAYLVATVDAGDMPGILASVANIGSACTEAGYLA